MKKTYSILLLGLCVLACSVVSADAAADIVQRPLIDYNKGTDVLPGIFQETSPGTTGNGTLNTSSSDNITSISDTSPYVISPSELPLIIDDAYVTSHGSSFILGGDWTGSSSVNNGIFIYTPNVTLDGDNHLLTGVTTGNPNPFPTGVLSWADNTTIKNIRVSGWICGICLAWGTSGHLENITATNNMEGILLRSQGGVNVTSNVLQSNSDNGIFLHVYSNNNILTGNTVSNNYHGINIHSESNNNSIKDNTANNNFGGFLLYNNSSNNTLEGNIVSDNDATGIESWGNENKILMNLVNSNSGGGIYLDGVSDNLVSGNEILDNYDGGIILYSTIATSPRNNTISNNTITGTGASGASSQNIGIILWTGSNSNTIRNNYIAGNNGGINLHDSTGNTMYNNYFNNGVWNTYSDGSSGGNAWSIPKSDGPNIVSGPNIGGNYWATPAGTGFSETTPDSNRDGFCDSSFNVISGAYPPVPTGEFDYLPLHNFTPVIAEIGVYRNSTHMFYLDYNGNGAWNGAVIDRAYNFGLTGDTPVAGDWDNNGTTEIGVFRPSTHMFYLDYNGNGAWNGAVIDRAYNFGVTGDTPVAGDWDNNGTTEIGVYRNSTHMFYLDYNGNGAWNGAVIDRAYNFGVTGDIPVAGDWDNNGTTEIGVFRPSTHIFYLDYNGNGVWDSAVIDRAYNFGLTGDIPVSGDWNEDGISEIGVFRPSTHIFYLDYNGNGVWNGAVIDRAFNFGLTGDSPVSGTWN